MKERIEERKDKEAKAENEYEGGGEEDMPEVDQMASIGHNTESVQDILNVQPVPE